MEAEKYPGLEVDISAQTINVIASVGMKTLGEIVNEKKAPFPIGLEGYTINQNVPVTLKNHVPIGSNNGHDIYYFKGTYNGNHQSITLESTNNNSDSDFSNIGIFGVNEGIIKDMNITVTGTIGDHLKSINVGAVCGNNRGKIYNSTVIIAKNAKVLGNENVAGVAGANGDLIKNSHLTNYGEIVATSSPCGGIVGFNMGKLHLPHQAIIDTAFVYNDGVIASYDDVGGVVGLSQKWYNNGGQYDALVTGDLDVTISKNGSIKCTALGGTASIGGVVGYNNRGTVAPLEDESMHIKLRLDGTISTSTGSSGGVIGEGQFNTDSTLTPYVSVTLGPDAAIIPASGGGNGLIASQRIDAGRCDKFVYAVPYDSTYYAFPGENSSFDVKRIEYPKEGNPVPTIKISDPSENSPTNVVRESDSGIFLKKDKLASQELKMVSALDGEIFTINKEKQTVESKYLTQENYYDFNMTANGIPIVVPAYLDVQGELDPPDMQLEIKGDNVQDTEEQAVEHPAAGKQDIEIVAVNGRITSWEITKEDVIYTNKVALKTNTNLKKTFSVSESGLYKITATGQPLDGSKAVAKTRYLLISGIPNIQITGNHLTENKTETWTNLRENEFKEEEVTIVSAGTTIEAHDVEKGAIDYQLYAEDYSKDIGKHKVFNLTETGRYRIEAKGKSMPATIDKYVNIDVDKPLPPILSQTAGETVYAEQDSIGYTLPTESMDQSPIYVEYKVDDGAYQKAGDSIPLSGKQITMQTVDMAGNRSNELVIDIYKVTVLVEPVEGGAVTGDGTYIKITEVAGTKRITNSTPFATIVATPTNGYTFDGWSNEGEDRYTENTHIFEVVGDTTYTAHFVVTPDPPPVPAQPPQTYITLTYLTEEGGKIQGENQQQITPYSDGEKVTAIAKEGYEFYIWSDGIQTTQRQEISRDKDLKVTALFIPIEKIEVVSPVIVKPAIPPKSGSKNMIPVVIAMIGIALSLLLFSVYKLKLYKSNLLDR